MSERLLEHDERDVPQLSVTAGETAIILCNELNETRIGAQDFGARWQFKSEMMEKLLPLLRMT